MPLWKRGRKQPEVQPKERRRGVSFGSARDVGQVRSTNQDQVLAMLTSLPGPREQIVMGLFIVADGMGGHTGGEIASLSAVETVATHVLQRLLLPVLKEEPPGAIQDVLQGGILAANQLILEEGNRQGSDMGTTITAALLLGNQVYVSHIGDTRLYTYGKGELQCHTRDHSMVARLLELGQITPEEARHHPKRNYLYQSVGQQEGIEVDVASFSTDGHSCMLLCSDGLWGTVEEEVLVEALSRDSTPQSICEWLIAKANEAGGEDNISAIVVAFPEPLDDSES